MQLEYPLCYEIIHNWRGFLARVSSVVLLLFREELETVMGPQDFSAVWVNCVMLYLSIAGLSSYADQRSTDELFRGF